MTKYEKYYDEIKKLSSKGFTNKEIANKLGIDGRRISEILRKLNIEKNVKKINFNLTKEAEEVIIGTVIGDGCLFKDKKAINYRMNLAHSLKQKEYFLMKYNFVKECVSATPRVTSRIDKRTNKRYNEIRFQTLSNEYFTRLYDIWYKDGKKVFPISEADKITPFVLAIKYFDDGWYSNNSNGGYIAMHDYSETDILNFKKILEINFGINSNIHKNKGLPAMIYITKKEFPKLKKIVLPYATSDVLYKLGELGETLQVKKGNPELS